MPTYLLSVCYAADAHKPPEAQLQKIMADLAVLNAELVAAGAWVFAGGLLEPATATVVTDHDGEIVMTDGPFIESKEQIGGLSIIEAPDLDAALGWAAKMATAITVPIEVRPFDHGSTG